uniref:Uncharacterized protein n=1 Tax=Romanomermis culicivorax TaxID=13658 RepID=A0A915IPX6_ROMCU
MPIEVEDWTPCAPGKLCIGGQCIEHPDAKHYVVPKAHPGGVRLVCNSSQVCARINGKLIDRERAQRYMTCENRSCHSHTFPIHLVGNELAIRFLSCSNPYPVEMDPGCFSNMSMEEGRPAPPPASASAINIKDYALIVQIYRLHLDYRIGIQNLKNIGSVSNKKVG